jgi:hypothetical protein
MVEWRYNSAHPKFQHECVLREFKRCVRGWMHVSACLDAAEGKVICTPIGNVTPISLDSSSWPSHYTDIACFVIT